MLETQGADVTLTLIHRHLTGEKQILNVCAGWHAHLALMVALVEGTPPPSPWNTWKRLRKDYEAQGCAH